jgi:hypothetical protein
MGEFTLTSLSILFVFDDLPQDTLKALSRMYGDIDGKDIKAKQLDMKTLPVALGQIPSVKVRSTCPVVGPARSALLPAVCVAARPVAPARCWLVRARRFQHCRFTVWTI